FSEYDNQNESTPSFQHTSRTPQPQVYLHLCSIGRGERRKSALSKRSDASLDETPTTHYEVAGMQKLARFLSCCAPYRNKTTLTESSPNSKTKSWRIPVAPLVHARALESCIFPDFPFALLQRH